MAVQVLKCRIVVEFRSPGQALLDQFNRLFNLKMNSEALQKLFSGVFSEVSELGNIPMDEFGLPQVEAVGEIWVYWREGVAKVRVQQPAVRVLVVASHKSVNVILVAEKSVILKAFLQLWSSYPTLSI